MMYKKSTQERLYFLEERLSRIELLVQSSFLGVSREIDQLEEINFENEQTLKEISKVLDIHFDLIKKSSKKK